MDSSSGDILYARCGQPNRHTSRHAASEAANSRQLCSASLPGPVSTAVRANCESFLCLGAVFGRSLLFRVGPNEPHLRSSCKNLEARKLAGCLCAALEVVSSSLSHRHNILVSTLVYFQFCLRVRFFFFFSFLLMTLIEVWSYFLMQVHCCRWKVETGMRGQILGKEMSRIESVQS